MSNKNIFLILIVLVISVPFVFARIVQPTTFYSQNGNSKLDGQSVPAGTVIIAYDPDGINCGNDTVDVAGEFVLGCNGDDPDTLGTDEGAVNSDSITFYMNGNLAVLTGGNNTWKEGEWKEINISATTCNDTDTDGYSLNGGGSCCGATHNQTCSATADCVDTNSSINPGATEVCNGVDDNCVGGIDESLTSPACALTQGVCAGSTKTCGGVAGWLGCNDSIYLAWNASYEAVEATCDLKDNDCDGGVDEGVQNTYYRDFDSDTYGNLSSTTQECTAPAGYVADNTDCNDNNAAVHPGATEVCNGIDDNCVGGIDESLTAPACALTQGVCAGSTQTCGGVAGWLGCNASVYLAWNASYEAVEATCDGKDNDCDGNTDEGVQTTFYRDFDSDTYGNISSTTQACTAPGGYVADNTDCNDNNAAVHPGATEVCNGIDDNCVGGIDESLSQACGSGACTGTQTCSAGSWGICSTNNNDAGICAKCNVSGYAIYDDTQDSDCSATTCAADGCGVGGCGTHIYGDFPTSVPNECSSINTCTNNVCTATCEADTDNDQYSVTCGDCNNTDSAMYPGNAEVCDDKDNNCNTEKDETFTNETCNYVCQTYGFTWTNNGGNLNCCGNNALEDNPYQATETSCSDGHDNDCDGSTDAVDTDCYACTPGDKRNCALQQGVCSGSQETCTAQGQWLGCNASIYLAWNASYEAVEATCDGKDNDCDGSIDENGNTICDDGAYCNGQETCNGVNGCQPGSTVDCSANNIAPVNTCTNNPDNNPFTWDYFIGFTSICNEGTDSCTTGTLNVVSTCNISECNAQCEENTDCAQSTCSQTYNDYCAGLKLVEYDSDKVMDSTTVDDSCDNTCEGNCSCTTCATDCSAPSTNTYCVKDVCSAECAIDADCDDSDSLTIDSCLSSCACQHQRVDCVVNSDCNDSNPCTDDVCSAANTCQYTNNNDACDDDQYCTVNDACSGGICTGSAKDCSANNIAGIATCTNDPDNNPFTWDSRTAFTSTCDEANDLCPTGSADIAHACSKTSCSAQCEQDTDCTCGTTGCIDSDSDGIIDDYREYPAHGTCENDCSCTGCDPTITTNDNRCKTVMRVAIDAGISMFSLPLIPESDKTFNNLQVGCVLTRSDGIAYWNPTASPPQYVYIDANTKLYPGEGYFTTHANNCYFDIEGYKFTSEWIGYLGSKQIKLGWNTIGAPSEQVNDVNTVKGTCATNSGPWGRNAATNQYVRTQVLAPGKGYFINSLGNCEFS